MKSFYPSKPFIQIATTLLILVVGVVAELSMGDKDKTGWYHFACMIIAFIAVLLKYLFISYKILMKYNIRQINVDNDNIFFVLKRGILRYTLDDISYIKLHTPEHSITVLYMRIQESEGVILRLKDREEYFISGDLFRTDTFIKHITKFVNVEVVS